MGRLKDLAEGPSPLARLIGNLDERPCRVVGVPGRAGHSVGLWVLTQGESELAKSAARRHVRERLKLTDGDLAADPQPLYDAQAIELLALALRDAEAPTNQWVESAQELRDRCSSDLISALYAEYLAYLDDESPLSRAEHLEQEVDELVQAFLAGSSAAAARARSYDGVSARKLLLTAAARLARRPSASSPDTSSPSDSAGSPSGS